MFQPKTALPKTISPEKLEIHRFQFWGQVAGFIGGMRVGSEGRENKTRAILICNQIRKGGSQNPKQVMATIAEYTKYKLLPAWDMSAKHGFTVIAEMSKPGAKLQDVSIYNLKLLLKALDQYQREVEPATRKPS